MGWLAEKWHQLVQSVVWQSLFARFEWLDWLVLGLLVFGVFYGAKKKLWKTFSDVIRLILVTVLTLEFYLKLSTMMGNYITFVPGYGLKMTAFILVTIAAWFAASILIKIFRKLFSAGSSSFLGTLGGMTFGALYVFLILSFISQWILLGPWQKLNAVYQKEQSLTGVYLAQTAPAVHARVAGATKTLIAKIKS